MEEDYENRKTKKNLYLPTYEVLQNNRKKND